MNKKNISLTLGSALASSLLSAAPAIQAGENPFAMTRIDQAQQLAEASDKGAEGGCSGKMSEGKCGEGKCGASKMKDMKAAEGGCSAKMPEAGCSAKMPEGSCGNKK
ncbi:MAG: HvfA family oxazolone/thioamide-modified RiPP metallophore [Gammaproteobacteria bacterium]